MANAALKPCLNNRRCRGFAAKGSYCAPCQQAYRQTTQQSNDQQRGTASSRGYDARWAKWRRWVIGEYKLVFCGDRPTGAPMTDHSRCQQAKPQRIYRTGEQLDHIEAIEGPDDPRRLDVTNVQWLCVTCHRTKTASEDGGFGNARRTA